MVYPVWRTMLLRVNNREAGDLRRHRAHYDVIVMTKRFNLFGPASSKVTLNDKGTLDQDLTRKNENVT